MRKTALVTCLLLTLTISACGKKNDDVNINVVTPKVEVTPKPELITEPKVTPEPEVTASIAPEEENPPMTLQITEIYKDYFTAIHPWPSPNTYKVYAKLPDTYCVNDYVEVEYDTLNEVSEFNFEFTALSVNDSDFELQEGVCYKPVIYLYPTQTTKVDVTLDYDGKLLVTEPVYDNGWTVTATPEGKIIDSTGVEYPYLFWEGENHVMYDMSKGFCVAGDETAEFLEEKLAFMGLSEQEAHDFEEFWVPRMAKNPYNLITFQTTQYTDHAKLTINPSPDSMLRVFMVFAPLDQYKEMEEQKLATFVRTGFTVIEWGGTYQR